MASIDGGVIVQALKWLLVVWLALAISYGIYNVYFHPLRHFPGPKLWAAYRFPYVNSHIRGILPFKVYDFHLKYGPVVRIAPNELAFTQPEAWQDIYGLQPGRIQNQRDKDSYTPPADGDFGDGFIDSADEPHKRLRRILGPAFTPKAVEDMGDMLQKYSNLLVDQLKSAIKTDPVQDISAWFNFTTFDLTGEFALGEAFHCLAKGGQSHFFLDTVLSGVVVGCQMWQLQRYGLLTLIEPFLPKSVMEKQYQMAAYTKNIIDHRLEKGHIAGHADVINYLMLNKRPEDQLPPSEIYENALTLVVAGSETTATLLAGTVYLLCKHPQIGEKVKKEVRSAFKSNDEITPRSVDGLTYMVAVLSEALRIFPPSPWGFPRIISTPSGQKVVGKWISEGTRCDIFHHAAYRYPSNFTRPLEFLPERWLPDAGSAFENDKRDVVQPFSFGPRGCIGKNLAIAEMRLMLAKMLYNFDFELAEPGKDWHESLRAYLIWDRTPFRVKLMAVKS